MCKFLVAKESPNSCISARATKIPSAMLQIFKPFLGLCGRCLSTKSCIDGGVRGYHASCPLLRAKRKSKGKRKAKPKMKWKGKIKDEYTPRLFPTNPDQQRPFMEVRDKVAIITGGLTGIGLAVAYELLRHGLHCAVCSGETCTDRFNAVKQLNERFGKGKAVYFPADVTNDLDFNRLFQYAIGRFNRVDILFNNAGLWTDCHWEACIDTNVCSIGRGSLLALDYMSAKSNGCGGVVVNLGSTMSFDSVPSCPAYCASQHAVVAITECLGHSFHTKDANLRIVTLCPGVTVSAMSYAGPHHHGIRLCNSSKQWLKQQRAQDTRPVAKAFLYIVKYGRSGHHYVIDGYSLSECTLPPKDDFAIPLCYYKRKRKFLVFF